MKRLEFDQNLVLTGHFLLQMLVAPVEASTARVRRHLLTITPHEDIGRRHLTAPVKWRSGEARLGRDEQEILELLGACFETVGCHLTLATVAGARKKVHRDWLVEERAVFSQTATEAFRSHLQIAPAAFSTSHFVDSHSIVYDLDIETYLGVNS